jgi:EAL domain-containing protein (putative c-di-GMP-specific phosphodiesterase class I)
MLNIKELVMQNNFYHLFQPICYLPKRHILGYEALIRSKSNFNPDEILRQGMEQNFLYDVDSLSIIQAISSYFASREARENDKALFLNVFPSTLVAASFPSLIQKIKEQFNDLCNRIVFEINESVAQGAFWSSTSFIGMITFLRDQGFKIALDDVGEGATNFKKIIEISPDFIKVDKFFAKELFTCRKKQKVVELFVEYCKEEIHLILEGIEHQDELEKALSLGITIGQGYLLGKPNMLFSSNLK